MAEITQILTGLARGENQRAGELLPLVYDELRRLAAWHLRNEPPNQTLQATALVHEAYLRLVGREDPDWNGRRHFFGAAAEAMRRILVENARRKKRLKRGGNLERVELEDFELPAPMPDDEMLALDEALDRLDETDPRAAELVKLRFFVGLTQEQAARELGVSISTVERTWAFARAWLFREIGVLKILRPKFGNSLGGLPAERRMDECREKYAGGKGVTPLEPECHMKESHICWNAKERRVRMSVAALAGLLLCSAHLAMAADDLMPGFSSQDQVVGECGDLGRAIFAGNETFGAETLRWGLCTDLDSVIASQPEASLDDCLRTLERRLCAGYAHAGFPETVVHAEVDSAARRIVLRVAEGPRFYCGKVRVKGLKTLAEEDLAAQILMRVAPGANTNVQPSLLQGVGETNIAAPVRLPWAPKSAVTLITNRSQVAEESLGIWAAGLGAPMDAVARRSLAEAATNAFADLGYFKAQFTLAFEPGDRAASNPPAAPDHRPLDMVVEVRDEGPACTIGEIEVSQLRKNSQAELLSWLGLTSGQRLTHELLVEKQARLVESGRFTVARLEPGTPDEMGRVKLRVVVCELDTAPALSAGLSPEEAALQQLRLWLQHWSDGQEDALVRLDARNKEGSKRWIAELTVSPGGNVLFRTSTARDSTVTPGWVFFATSNSVALIDAAGRERLCVATNWQGELQLKAGIGIDPDGRCNFSFAGGFNISSPARPVQVELQILPAAVIQIARRPDVRWHIERGRLIGSSSNAVLQVDAQTGRLIEWRFVTDRSDAGMIEMVCGFPIATMEVALQFETHALGPAMAKATAASAGFTNCYEPQHPWSSALAFLTKEALCTLLIGRIAPTNATAQGIAAATAALGKLVDREQFTHWERVLGSTNGAGEEPAFVIPPDASSAATGANPLDYGAALALSHRGELVAPESWIGILICENALSLSRRADLAGKGWERLFTSPDTGPLACFVAAHCVNPEAARAFAISGLTRLTRENFRADYEPLLEGDGILPATTTNLLARLATLSDPEIESLAVLLSRPDAAALRETVRVLRQPGITPGESSLGPVLDLWWDGSLHSRLSAALRQLCFKRQDAQSVR